MVLRERLLELLPIGAHFGQDAGARLLAQMAALTGIAPLIGRERQEQREHDGARLDEDLGEALAQHG